jgi:hypothetical protein
LVETLYGRRPLRARRKALKSLPLGHTFHPVDPPLEPQNGRLHNLRPNPQDEPDIAQYCRSSYLSAEMPVVSYAENACCVIAEMSGVNLELFARSGCACYAPQSSSIGKDTTSTHKNASEVPERHQRGGIPAGAVRRAALESLWLAGGKPSQTIALRSSGQRRLKPAACRNSRVARVT